jgi:C1A family cysteine protease
MSRGNGWLPDPPDERDHCYHPGIVKAKSAENLHENEKYCAFWGEVYDQGELNSCVGCASAAQFHFELKKDLAARNDQQPQHLSAINPSRIFIWYYARLIDKVSKFDNAYCHTRSAMKSLHQMGVCCESLCGYPSPADLSEPTLTRTSQCPTDDAQQAAKKYRILRYERLDTKRSNLEKDKLAKLPIERATQVKDADGELLKENLRKAITEGHPVQFGFHYYEQDQLAQFMKVDKHRLDGRVWALATLPGRHKKPRKGYGSHAVLAIGYDDDYVICQSSWGSQAYDHGTFLTPWSWVTDFEATDDFWILGGFVGVD